MKFTEKELSFELHIIGYQYPASETEPYDSNWLVVQLKVTSPQVVWSITDPCLLTYEARHLADWFDQINSGNPQKDECSFMEPAISFRIAKNDQQKYLRIRFAHEAPPAWANGQDEYFIEFALSNLDFYSASEDIRRQLEQFPQRANV